MNNRKKLLWFALIMLVGFALRGHAADADLYRANFEKICQALAESLAKESAEVKARSKHNFYICLRRNKFLYAIRSLGRRFT
jgi:hypothetical protein